MVMACRMFWPMSLGTNQATRATRAAAEILVFTTGGQAAGVAGYEICPRGVFLWRCMIVIRMVKNDILVAEDVFLHILCHQDGFDLKKAQYAIAISAPVLVSRYAK